jgi:hypothetical protein
MYAPRSNVKKNLLNFGVGRSVGGEKHDHKNARQRVVSGTRNIQ